MTNEGSFLITLGQALATMSLYAEGHPARERVIDAAFEHLLLLLEHIPSVQFSFFGDEAIIGARPMNELAGWEWASRLAAAGVERIEVDAEVTRAAYVRFMDEVWARLAGAPATTSEARQLVRSPIRFGALRLDKPAGGPELSDVDVETVGVGAVRVSLAEELDAVAWMHTEVERGESIPLMEAEAVVGSLSASMHAERQLLLPLLTIKEFDQYTLTHSCNVAMLAMGLSEQLGLDSGTVRAFGIAGLLHDIGKVRIPRDLLVKPGRYSDAERTLIRAHPVEGARIILARPGGSDLAAVVAYEHHIFLDGRGYPTLAPVRAAHYASRIVHVCDVYDALCTERPYRKPWSPEEALTYIEQQAGTELDPTVSKSFAAMIRGASISRTPMTEMRRPAATTP
jgi:putative nucleotidyltransferase with HDIG domain